VKCITTFTVLFNVPTKYIGIFLFFQQDPVVEDISYRSPTPSGNVYFVEHFDDINQFNKKWVLSEAKKDDIDDDIAKYDG
jgi:calnexin